MKSLKQKQCNAWVVLFQFAEFFHYLAQIKCKIVTAIINLIYINFKFQKKVSVKFAGGVDCE
jgi:hypothetical protein